MRLADLPDERRAAKPWLPEDDRDVANGLVTLDRASGTPHCSLHGAMHRVHPHEQVWRCGEYRCGLGGRLTP